MSTPTQQSWQHQRARIARLTQSYPPDAPVLLEARQSFHAARLEDQLVTGISAGIRLSDDQIKRLVALLVSGGDHHA